MTIEEVTERLQRAFPDMSSEKVALTAEFVLSGPRTQTDIEHQAWVETHSPDDTVTFSRVRNFVAEKMAASVWGKPTIDELYKAEQLLKANVIHVPMVIFRTK